MLHRYFLLSVFVLFSICLVAAAPATKQNNDTQKKNQKTNKNTKKQEAKTTQQTKKAMPAISNNSPGRPEGKITCLEKEFKLETGIETEPEVKLTCIVPIDEKGKATEGANDIVFYSPFAGARNALAKRPELRRYANALGMTIFTIEITTDTKYLGNEEKYYCYSVSGWHEVALNACKKIQEEFGLEKRKLLIVGDSVGGSYAQQIASHYPDAVDAAAFVGGRLYGDAKPNNISWLILSTWECPGMESSREIASAYEALDVNVLQTETPPVLPGNPSGHLYHHSASRIAYEIMEDYISGVRDLRKQNNGTVPAEKDWPVHETILGKSYSFPSMQTANGWKQLPLGIRAEISKHERMPVVLEPTTANKDSKVIIYAHDSEIKNTVLEDNMCYIALQGNYAVALNSGASSDNFQYLCNYVKNQFPNKDVYAIGAYESGAALAAACMVSGLKVKRVTLLNSDFDYLLEILNNSKAKSYNKMKITILMDQKTAEAPNNKYGIEVENFNTKDEFGPAWFSALSAGMDG